MWPKFLVDLSLCASFLQKKCRFGPYGLFEIFFFKKKASTFMKYQERKTWLKETHTDLARASLSSLQNVFNGFGPGHL